MKNDETKRRLFTSFYNEFVDQGKIAWSKSELVERLQNYGGVLTTHDFLSPRIQSILKELEQDGCVQIRGHDEIFLEIIPPQPNWKEIILKAIRKLDSRPGEVWSKNTLQRVLNHSLAIRTQQVRNPESSGVQTALKELETEGVIELIYTDAIYLRIKPK